MTQTDRVTGFISDTAIKAPVIAATTAAITLAGEQTVDGVALVTDDRVLVKNQGSSVDNGIYVVDTGAWSRAPDFDGVYDIVRGTTLFVVEGSANGSQYWRVSTAGIITIGTTGLSFERALVNDSSTIIFTQAGTGAVATTVQGKLRQQKSLFDFIDPSLWSSIQAGTNTTVLTAFIQAALDSGAKKLTVPYGTYLTGTLVVPSGVILEGEGWATIFRSINTLNAPVIKNSGATTDFCLRDFKISGNSANQLISNSLRAGIYLDTNASSALLENLWLDDINDWGVEFLGTDVTVRRCRASNIIGINDTNGVRAGFLFGTSVIAATRITADDCVVSGITQPFVDGFVFENGSDISLTNSRAIGIPYTGFKLKMDDMRVIGNRASGCYVGFQTQGPLSNLTQTGNTAYRNNASGFQYNQTSGTARDWVITSNKAIENGQAPAGGQSYGFNFDNSAGATTDRVIFTGNSGVDNGAGTQTRGLSVGALGTYSHMLIGPNILQGNTADIVVGASFDTTTSAVLLNPGLAGTSSHDIAYGRDIKRLDFSAENIPQSSGTIACTKPGPARGYVMPKPGHIKSVYGISNAAVTAGSLSIAVRKNGTNVDNVAWTSGTTATIEFLFQQAGTGFVAGDIIDLTYNANGAFLPNGTADFDFVVEVVY